MAVIKHTWTIANMERNVGDGGVVICHWRCEASDGGKTTSSYGTTSHTPNPDDPNFVGFSSLTEDDVLNWVFSVIDKVGVEDSLVSAIEALNNPTTILGKPW